MNRIIVGLIAVATALFAAVPAQAVTVPGCFGGEFLLFAKSHLEFELGATDMTGDVILLNSTGTVKVGASNRIHGTIFANAIFLGTGSIVDKCVANSISGPGTCTDKTDVGPGKFAPPAACDFPPLAVPSFPDPCIPGGNKIIDPPGSSLPPGCYNTVRVQKNATLTLEAGKTVEVKQEFRMIMGSSVVSDTPGSPASLVVKGAALSEAAVNIKDVNITSLGGPGNNFHVGNGSKVIASVLFSPNGEIHLHTGSRLEDGSELVAVRLELQPFTAPGGGGDLFCECPLGFLNEPGPPASWSQTTKDARLCKQQ